jgi:uncharacterized protein DUF4288
MWFGVNLLFRSIRPDEREDEALWEERVFVLRAPDEAMAHAEAERIGKAEEHDYQAADGGHVRWTFVQVERVYSVPSDSLESGTEVFSRFLRTAEVRSLLTPFED